jgi:hypothetical protein
MVGPQQKKCDLFKPKRKSFKKSFIMLANIQCMNELYRHGTGIYQDVMSL